MTRVTALSPNDERDARAAYVQQLRARYGRFAQGFDHSPMNALTPDTYVEQHLVEVGTDRRWEARAVVGVAAQQGGALLHPDPSSPPPRGVVIVGPAGRGKTSLLYWLMWTLVGELERHETAAVPVYVPLQEWRQVGSLDALYAYLDAHLADGRVAPWLRARIETGPAVFLLDALDAVPEEKRRHLLRPRGMLAALMQRLRSPQARIVLTCREAVYDTTVQQRVAALRGAGDGAGWVTMTLQPLTRQQTESYATRFFGDAQTAQRFLQDLAASGTPSCIKAPPAPALSLAQEPLYLHLLCWLWAGRGAAPLRLPTAEDELWPQVLARLLAQRQADERQAGAQLHLLEELAFHSRVCRQALTRPFVNAVATVEATETGDEDPRGRARQWVRDLVRWELLRRRGPRYAFALPPLADYCAARYLAARWADPAYRHWLPAAPQYGSLPMAELDCPHPACRARVSSFRDLFHQAEHDHILLLLVGLLGDRDRERGAVNNFGLENDLFALQALLHCRHAHPPEAARLVAHIIRSAVSPHRRQYYPYDLLWDSFAATTRARVRANFAAIVTALIEVMREVPRHLTGVAAHILKHFGPEAVAPLITALQAGDTVLRQEAAVILWEIGDERAAEPLIAALRDTDFEVQSAAVMALHRLKGKVAAAPLVRLLEAPNRVTQMLAASLLRDLGDPQVIPLLRALLADPTKPHAHQAAARVLRALEMAHGRGE